MALVLIKNHSRTLHFYSWTSTIYMGSWLPCENPSLIACDNQLLTASDITAGIIAPFCKLEVHTTTFRYTIYCWSLCHAVPYFCHIFSERLLIKWYRIREWGISHICHPYFGISRNWCSWYSCFSFSCMRLTTKAGAPVWADHQFLLRFPSRGK